MLDDPTSYRCLPHVDIITDAKYKQPPVQKNNNLCHVINPISPLAYQMRPDMLLVAKIMGGKLEGV